MLPPCPLSYFDLCRVPSRGCRVRDLYAPGAEVGGGGGQSRHPGLQLPGRGTGHCFACALQNQRGKTACFWHSNPSRGWPQKLWQVGRLLCTTYHVPQHARFETLHSSRDDFRLYLFPIPYYILITIYSMYQKKNTVYLLHKFIVCDAMVDWMNRPYKYMSWRGFFI